MCTQGGEARWDEGGLDRPDQSNPIGRCWFQRSASNKLRAVFCVGMWVCAGSARVSVAVPLGLGVAARLVGRTGCVPIK
jgi:hypothetical protein